ncbi:hypothetical protein [Verrucomicrobium sp. BvORR106]|uniref:hypothetical protein n=1 Tax=Verrucomicrobium sp. BvORR106 TaxID=1403819 RepID=UPI00056EE09E|nr:hypothetical protein [Verrucomicrobium sp. BvORR106]
MKMLASTVVAIACLLISGQGPAFGGQALFAPIKDFLDRAGLVVVVDVKKVTEVTVPTGDDQASKIYVAEAEVLQTLKSDVSPTPNKRKIAIVGSTIPMSSAVWTPIESGRYLAFLNSEQGHYRYSEKYDLRPIIDGKVDWIDKKPNGTFELLKLDIEEAIKKIQNEQSSSSTPAHAGG